MTKRCGTCGGHLEKLGRLGLLEHWRCIACGLDWNWPVDLEAAAEEAAAREEDYDPSWEDEGDEGPNEGRPVPNWEEG